MRRFFQVLILLFLVLFLFLFALSWEHEIYFSNSDKKNLEEKYFTLQCNYYVEPSDEERVLKIELNYNNIPTEKVDQSKLQVLPIVSETGDTLNFKSNYAGNYYFTADRKIDLGLDLVMNFDVDSLGIVLNKRIYYSKLKKISKWRFRPVWH